MEGYSDHQHKKGIPKDAQCHFSLEKCKCNLQKDSPTKEIIRMTSIPKPENTKFWRGCGIILHC